MNNIHDLPQRERALDPTTSFIVQAPAGSGKTELLIQRLLVLLGHVKQPEEILAITFTKKSAAEMRIRIMNALTNALHFPKPGEVHTAKTWALAKKVLQQDQQYAWNLLNNPNRLRVQTIDSFNAYLTKRLPILSHFGASPGIAEDATPLYRQAVQEFLSHLEENVAWADAIAKLLLHLDNDLGKLEKLLINLLAKRDQWLPYIVHNTSNPVLRQTLEKPLATILQTALARVQYLITDSLREELFCLAHFSLKNLPETMEKDVWFHLPYLLLTKEHEWRKRVDTSIGFPSPASTKNSQDKNYFTDMKQRMKAVLEQLQDNDELKTSLVELSLCPATCYQDKQWEILQALHQILCVVAAQLKVIFQQHTKIDYIENAQAALFALGTEDAPTDITLALDYQIKHILIDEFQDTSNSQYRLIAKLITGWEPHDGRTLFVVGDPMQSIYRFREAEVGLFLRARNQGIGHIKLEPLTLSVNFRSTVKIVNWVNEHFQKIFPQQEDIATGAIPFHPSVAAHAAVSDASFVRLHASLAIEPAEQAKKIVHLIQTIKHANPNETIAILVRARTQLASIIPELQQAKLSYRAIDIDPLDSRPVIQDLMALTCALFHPADRIAWLTVLRAPWCGLTLEDLLLLSGNHLQVSLWQQLQSAESVAQLSGDGQQRLARILPILKAKIAERARYPARLWVETTWLALGGPACVRQHYELNDAAAFFDLLEEMDKSGIIIQLETVREKVKKLYAPPNNTADATLQIMTIYNAKGLEFDTVILPHLEYSPRHDDKELLLWMEYNTNSLIMAPLQATGDEQDSIYEYIKRQNKIKTDHENGRLLYVVATRAKHQLHLFFNAQKNSQGLLKKLWPTLQHSVDLPELVSSSSYSAEHMMKDNVESMLQVEKNISQRLIQRLTFNWKNPVHESDITPPITYHNKNSGFYLPDHKLRFIGIVVHQILQQMGCLSANWWQEKSATQRYHYLHRHFIQLGMSPSNLPAAIAKVTSAIENTLQDPRGQWILAPHQDAKTEFQLTALIDNNIDTLVIDRTFIDERGIRWIIDYKTTYFVEKNREKFLIEEQQKYFQQMSRYQQAIRQIDSRPIQLGLYFPLIPAWKEWA